MSIEFYRVTSREEIISRWGMIRNGFVAILEKGTGDDSLELILNDLMSGYYILWIVEQDDDFAGLFTTRVEKGFYHDEPILFLLVKHLYLNKKDPTIVVGVRDKADEIVRECGCKFVKVYSTLDIARHMEMLGFARGYTEYIREVSE